MLSFAIIDHSDLLTCCSFCAQLGNGHGDGKDIGVALEQGEFNGSGVDGQLKLLDVEGVDTGSFTVESVLAGIAVRLCMGYNGGALGTTGIP